MSLPSDPAPLILTLLLEPAAQTHFTELRQQHFPPERNFLAAHVTLFHHLPGAEQPAILAQLQRLADTNPPLTLQVSGVRFLGRGVAYTLESPELQHLHRQLQQAWAGWLTPQDQQPLRPHITVQNKVDPARARALHAQLQAGFTPSTVQGQALGLWAYRGGPWEPLAQVPLTGAAVGAG